jgi:hypothetical protein
VLTLNTPPVDGVWWVEFCLEAQVEEEWHNNDDDEVDPTVEEDESGEEDDYQSHSEKEDEEPEEPEHGVGSHEIWEGLLWFQRFSLLYGTL